MNMSTKTHAILSELHKLLSTYSVQDFREARNYSGLSRAMKAALDALCREAAPRGGPNDRSTEKFRSGHTVLKSTPGGRFGLEHFTNRDDLLMAIRQSVYFENLRLLSDLVRNFGLRIQSRPKESKDKFARRLAGAILDLPESKKTQVISQLKSGAKSQTEGWIDVIRNSIHE